MSSERIEELKKQIADLKKRWPAHSVPPTLMEQLDELEEELRELECQEQVFPEMNSRKHLSSLS